MGFARLEHAGAAAPLFSLPFPACGEGFGKGNLVALSSSEGVRDPLRNGSRVFVTFYAKK